MMNAIHPLCVVYPPSADVENSFSYELAKKIRLAAQSEDPSKLEAERREILEVCCDALTSHDSSVARGRPSAYLKFIFELGTVIYKQATLVGPQRLRVLTIADEVFANLPSCPQRHIARGMCLARSHQWADAYCELNQVHAHRQQMALPVGFETLQTRAYRKAYSWILTPPPMPTQMRITLDHQLFGSNQAFILTAEGE